MLFVETKNETLCFQENPVVHVGEIAVQKGFTPLKFGCISDEIKFPLAKCHRKLL